MSRKSRIPSQAIYNTLLLFVPKFRSSSILGTRRASPLCLRHWALGWQGGGTRGFEYRSLAFSQSFTLSPATSLSLSLSLSLFLPASRTPRPGSAAEGARGRRGSPGSPRQSPRSGGHSPATGKHTYPKLLPRLPPPRTSNFQVFTS